MTFSHSDLYKKLALHQQQEIIKLVDFQTKERRGRRKVVLPKSRELVGQERLVADHLARLIDPEGKLLSNTREIMRTERARSQNAALEKLTLRSPPRVTDGSMRWVATFPVSDHNISVTQTGSNKAQIRGAAADLGDDRVIFDVGATFLHMIEPNVLQPSGENPPRWTSGPVASVFGYVYGYTDLQFILSYGDKWAKCRLKFHQEVNQIPSAAPPIKLGSSTYDETISIINEENNNQWVIQPLVFDQWLLPSASFSLANSSDPVFTFVSVLFEIELEGSAAISFGEPWPNGHQFENPTDIELFPWTPSPWNRY